MFKNKLWLLFNLSVFTALCVVGLLILDANSSQSTTNDAAFKQQVKNAIAELEFPSGGDVHEVSRASDKLAAFISYRAGVLLSDSNLNGLKAVEHSADSQSKRITKSELAEILTQIASERLRNLTDTERDSAIDALRGFDHPDLPASFRQGRQTVLLRANGRGAMTIEEIQAQIDGVRGDNVDSKLVQSLIGNSIALEIEQIVGVLSESEPNFFGETKGDMTPLQAFLVSYAVVTDDLLAGNRSDIEAKMAELQTGFAAAADAPYPSPEGQKPYGRNGYVFSTPADLLMDEEAVAMLLAKIAEKLN